MMARSTITRWATTSAVDHSSAPGLVFHCLKDTESAARKNVLCASASFSLVAAKSRTNLPYQDLISAQSERAGKVCGLISIGALARFAGGLGFSRCGFFSMRLQVRPAGLFERVRQLQHLGLAKRRAENLQAHGQFPVDPATRN